MTQQKSAISSKFHRSDGSGQKRMNGVPVDFDEVKSLRISGAITPTSRKGFDQFQQKYNLKSMNQALEILGRIAMQIPPKIFLPLIDAECSQDIDN